MPRPREEDPLIVRVEALVGALEVSFARHDVDVFEKLRPLGELLEEPGWSETDLQNIFALTRYEMDRRERIRQRRSGCHRRARWLLRSLLDAEQRAELARTGGVRTRGSAGGMYRLWPRTGGLHRVEWRTKRWQKVAMLCGFAR